MTAIFPLEQQHRSEGVFAYRPLCINRLTYLSPHHSSASMSSISRIAPRLTRSLATLPNAASGGVPLINSHGGLKDQDRIFSNLYRQGDNGIKGAMVSFHLFYCYHFFPDYYCFMNSKRERALAAAGQLNAVSLVLLAGGCRLKARGRGEGRWN